MGRTLVVFAVLVLAISGFPRASQVDAQGEEPITGEITFRFLIHGQPNPADYFELWLDYCNPNVLCPAEGYPGQLICGNLKRYLDANLMTETDWPQGFAGPCKDGGVYTIKSISTRDNPIWGYQITRLYENEVGESDQDRLSSGYPVVDGGIYVADYTYPTEATPPNPPAERPLPEGPPEVGGGWMSERRTPSAPPARWGGGGSSIAHRR
ncbi:MAG: hypothetical protein WKH64_11980 [Chloroflexia bacterium]